ncbi:MAG: peptide chain release factor 2 [Patescibacteria group bacterium]
MENILKKLDELNERFLKTRTFLNIDKKSVQVKELKERMSAPDFWDDQKEAVKVSQLAENLSKEINVFEKISGEIKEIKELASLAEAETAGAEIKETEIKESDNNFTAELTKKYEELNKEIADLDFLALFSEKYDIDNALLSIHSGTGGIDAQDWAEMLERMYLRFAEQKKFKTEILDLNYGQEAGIKSAMLRISGDYAYGYLKSENGVHRLLRNSPFNADGLRQTSFALVEVIPELPDDESVVIKDEDLRIDVFRSSGPGGQSVNTTDSAVRIVHIPTGITISCQSERSQHQNKENALKILKAKLTQLAISEREGEERKLKGELTKAEWGRQIRSYFMYGNRLVKDHRTDFETSNVEAVLDGNLGEFIEAYLRYLKK